MSIANEWFTDYQNELVVHAQLVIYYSGTGGFTVGETIQWTGGAETAIVVAEDTTNDMLYVVFNTETPAGATAISTPASGSGATCTVGSTSGMNTATVNYDTSGTGGLAADTRIDIGSAECTVINDDTSNSIITVKYIDNSGGDITDNDIIYDGVGGSDTGARVNGAPAINKTTYTVRQLYSFIQDTFDELVQMDDTVPMSAQTPTEFTMINGWFIDDDSTQYLSGGAIATSGWLDEIRVLTFDGYTNAVPSDIGLPVVGGTTTDSGLLLHYNNTDQQWWVRMDAADDIFDDAAETISITGGTGTGDLIAVSVTGETLYANVYTLGTIQTTPSPKTYIFQNGVSLSEWWGRGDSEAHIDVLVKVSEADTEIDGAQITVFVRHFADLFDHFPIDLTSGGRNAVPLATQEDLNNNATGEISLTYSSGAGTWTVGQFVKDVNTDAYGEILADSGTVLTVGNVTSPLGTSVFTTAASALQESSDGLLDDGDATADLDSIASTVRGYNDIGIYFVNATFSYDSGGTTEPTLYERIYQGAGGATDPSGYIVAYTLGSGTWAGGDAAGTITIANWNSITFADNVAINGSTAGADFATADNAGGETIANSITKAFEQGTLYPYNVIVECAGRTMTEVYEWFKYVTREDANSTAPAAFNHITMYRVNDAGTAVVEEDGEEYISAQTTYTPVKASPFGTLAGGKLFGATGVWVENMDNADRQNFQLIDSNGSTRVPPNFITITVNSVVSGDKVSVFRTSSGATIEKDQFTSHATLNDDTDQTFEVQETIPTDTPSSGYIRIVDVSDTSINREIRRAYSSWTGSIFTLSGGHALDRDYDGTDTAYVPYYDEISGDTSVSVTVIYATSQTVLTRVRQYDNSTPANSILPFQITGTVSTSGYTVAAIRTADTIVTAY